MRTRTELVTHADGSTTIQSADPNPPGRRLPEATDRPCRQCPWRLGSAPGYLGPHDARTWVEMVHSDVPIACHMTIKTSGSWEGAKQCAGAASYRANAEKRPRDPLVAWGPKRDDVFSRPHEFVRHHDIFKEPHAEKTQD